LTLTAQGRTVSGDANNGRVVTRLSFLPRWPTGGARTMPKTVKEQS